MASTILIVLLGTFLLRAAFSLPISQKSVQLDSVPNIELIVRTVVFDLETMRRDENIEVEKSLDSEHIDAVKRMKREAIVAHSCPEGYRWLPQVNRCVTLEQYNAATGDDDE